MLGGAAHLLNFDGTDTLSAAYYVQFALNGGRPVAQSIPATEHSVMTAWPSGGQWCAVSRQLLVWLCHGDTWMAACRAREEGLCMEAFNSRMACRWQLDGIVEPSFGQRSRSIQRQSESARSACCDTAAEAAAISNMIQHFGSGIFASVMDSYDYERVSNLPCSASAL